MDNNNNPQLRTDTSLLFLLLTPAAAGLGPRRRGRGSRGRRLERRVPRVLVEVVEQLGLGLEDGVATRACLFRHFERIEFEVSQPYLFAELV